MTQTVAGQELLDFHMRGFSISEHDPEDEPCWLASQIALIENQARHLGKQERLRAEEEDRL